MIKYFAGRIAGYGELFAKMDIIQTYGGDYSLYKIVKIEQIYWTNGSITMAASFEGTHIPGGDYSAFVRDTFAEARESMLQYLQIGRDDLQQAITQVDFFIDQVSDVRNEPCSICGRVDANHMFDVKHQMFDDQRDRM